VYNNPSLSTNVQLGGLTGTTTFALLAAVAVANIVGFSEVEVAEGGGAALGGGAGMMRFLLAASEASHPAVAGVYSTGVGLTTGVLAGVAVTQAMCRDGGGEGVLGGPHRS
jgi:hypothetical protein